MTTRFVGEIQVFGFSFAPSGWAFAGGQLLALRQNTALFSLLGTTYGGDGVTTFQLPNLVSRFACNSGSGPGLTQRTIGEPFGDQKVTVLQDQLPAHTHILVDYQANSVSDQSTAPSSSFALGFPGNGSFSVFAPQPPAAVMNPAMIGVAGGTQPHANVQPFLSLNYSIALQGDFPSFS